MRQKLDKVLKADLVRVFSLSLVENYVNNADI